MLLTVSIRVCGVFYVVHLMMLCEVNNLYNKKWWVVNDVERHSYHTVCGHLPKGSWKGSWKTLKVGCTDWDFKHGLPVYKAGVIEPTFNFC